MKKLLIGLLGMALVIGFSAQSIAEEQGNARKGKYAYRGIYKACFESGVVDSEKPPISPDEKTQAQWDRVFHKKDFEDFGCPGEWNQLNEKQLADIHAYLHAHAADSPSPAKCK